MAHVIFEKCTTSGAEGSVKVATEDKLTRPQFRDQYLPAMQATEAKFDSAGKFYTLSQELWAEVRPILEGFGLTVSEKPIPTASARVRTLNRWQKAALAGLPAKLRDLATLIEGGNLTEQHLKVAGKIVDLL